MAYTFARNPDGLITTVHDTTQNLLFLYSYDDQGTRVRKRSISGGLTIDRLYVTAGYEVDLTSGSENHQVHVFSGGIRAATLQREGVGSIPSSGSQDVLHYHPNHLGSNEVISNATGQIVKETYMNPFAGDRFEVAGPGAQPGVSSAYTFTDQEADAETGLDYFVARYYDPVVGRFLSQDPDSTGAGAGRAFSYHISDPQLANLYGYAGNRPTAYIDPSGRTPIVVDASTVTTTTTTTTTFNAGGGFSIDLDIEIDIDVKAGDSGGGAGAGGGGGAAGDAAVVGAITGTPTNSQAGGAATTSQAGQATPAPRDPGNVTVGLLKGEVEVGVTSEGEKSATVTVAPFGVSAGITTATASLPDSKNRGHLQTGPPAFSRSPLSGR